MTQRIVLGGTIAVAMALAAGPVSASYKCACETNAKADMEASTSAKIACVETYNGFNNSVSVQESHLKIYVDSKNVVQGDRDANIRFRPRDGKCLEAVADGNQRKELWRGAWCNNSSYLDIGQFRLDKETNDGKESWVGTYSAQTSGKDYTGFVSFSEISGKRYMMAACIENK